ncbi:hypothetical protein Tfer_2869 [Thermincola ferriacetica]|uniref:tRNA(Met) cytidine acetate ligase n=1 Tax=Thermincola ferriacetica TaxID=281456 RepID=A0A0L6VZ38_9FIRM|nr:nucleotidyltransferase [Thermincola ferriacetica]KNZ68540.1 hypothetical protein Tfer_2869 [Thermincola ferriacetica]
MRVVGLVTEYNPFHNGHLFHLTKAKELAEAEYALAVMSGHFLQRGEPALLDKWTRARMAIAAGVDLVLELPYVFSSRSANAFACGAVSILHGTGIVTHLCFGSEAGNIEPLAQIARLYLQEPPELSALIKKQLKSGLILPLAQTKALAEYLHRNNMVDLKPEILNNPNNILGIEYLRCLMALNSPIKPLTVQRIAAGYHDRKFRGSFASATGIREFLFTNRDIDSLKDVMPSTSLKILKEELSKGYGPVSWENFFPILLYCLRTADPAWLTNILDITEGLENRVLSLLGEAASFRSLVEKIKTKRYTWTRIQRVLNYILMEYTKEDAAYFDEKGPQYIRVLAVSEKGRLLLAKMRKKAALPLITRVAPAYKKGTALMKRMLDYDIKSSDIYTLGYGNAAKFVKGRDFVTGPIVVK